MKEMVDFLFKHHGLQNDFKMADRNSIAPAAYRLVYVLKHVGLCFWKISYCLL